MQKAGLKIKPSVRLKAGAIICTMPCHKNAGVPMTHAEQHRLIEELRELAPRMSRKDEELFDMCRKRDKDDEDLDDLSLKKLVEMHNRYVNQRKRH
jgi:hypothetical protein